MSILDPVIENARKANPAKPEDFVGEDGYLHCGVCGEPREFDITVMGRQLRVPVICECDRREARRLEEIRQAQRIEHNRELAFSDKPSRFVTFERDLAPQSLTSLKVRKYVDSFEQGVKWLVLFGECGTGKSFYAKCAANAVIDKGFTVKLVTLSEVERMLWKDRSGDTYDWLDSFDLLILDDLFAERDTDYMREIVFNLTDLRSRSGKPLIVTTNLNADGFVHPKDQARERIVSRLKQHSAFVPTDGKDKRS